MTEYNSYIDDNTFDDNINVPYAFYGANSSSFISSSSSPGAMLTNDWSVDKVGYEERRLNLNIDMLKSMLNIPYDHIIYKTSIDCIHNTFELCILSPKEKTDKEKRTEEGWD